jgi:shikimate kinase
MTSNIYLIGPSGVGKTNYARHAAAMLLATHRDLDKLCQGNQFNWSFCERRLKAIEREARSDHIAYLVDIGAGAGTQCCAELVKYLEPRQQSVVLIYAPPSELIRRNPCGPGRSPEEYEQTEYKSRRPLHGIATHSIDVSGQSE